MYSAALSWRQTEDLFSYFMFANDTRMPTRPTTLGCSGYNNKCSTYTAYGMACKPRPACRVDGRQPDGCHPACRATLAWLLPAA
jgi:hypothetical protein